MEKVKNVICVGECMVEFSPTEPGHFKQGFAGDTYNTAVYLKRQFGDSLRVSYFTALGADPMSAAIQNMLWSEDVDTGQIRVFPDRQPGLYLIENDATGERFFQYWRSRSAATIMFRGMETGALSDLLSDFDLVYLTGISLGILDKKQRQTLFEALALLKGNTKIAFDPNFRAALWPDLEESRTAFQSMGELSSIVLSTIDDDRALWGHCDVNEALDRWRNPGCQEVIIRDGAEGCVIFANEETEYVRPPQPLSPIDTTGAGDSFCAGYLGARLDGASPVQAAHLAHSVAAQVIMHRGGVMPRDQWTCVPKEY